MDISPIMKRVLATAIEKAQRKINQSKDGVFYLDFQREIDSNSLPQQFMDIEIHIDANLIDLIKCDEVFFNSDFTQYSVFAIDGYRKWSEVMLT